MPRGLRFNEDNYPDLMESFRQAGQVAGQGLGNFQETPPQRKDQPEYGIWPSKLKPTRDVTTGLHRIETPREDLIPVIRGGGERAQSYFNPHTGTNYPSILEGMWGGIKKPMKERITTQADVRVAGIQEKGFESLKAELSGILKGLQPPTDTPTDTPDRGVATPGLGVEAGTPGIPDTPAAPEGEYQGSESLMWAGQKAKRLWEYLRGGGQLEDYQY